MDKKSKKSIDPELKREFHVNLAERKAALAQNLKVARNAAGKLQEDLIGPNVSTRITISKIEAERGDPRLSSIVSLATSLGVSPVLLLITGDELLELARKLEKWRVNKARVGNKPLAVSLELSRGAMNNQMDTIQENAQEWLKPRNAPEKIGIAIGTLREPGDGSYIGKMMGRALSK